jgi:putative inorganic carbon (HCO3(-)) transporter
VADSVQADDLPQEPPVWKDFCDWQDYRLLGGLSLGLGLAMISVALNGFTDDLLFNIPTSMFLWTLLAMIAAVAEFNQPAEEESEPAPVEEPISDWGNALGTDAAPEKTEDDPFAKMYADPVPAKKQAEVKAETKAAAQTEPAAEEKAAATAETPVVETAPVVEPAPATEKAETVETAEKAEKVEKAAASESESQSPTEVKDEVKNEVKDAKVQLKTTGEEKHDEKSDDHIKGDH